ncbi:MAG: hypothetical protein GXO26_01830 [Crenarchaeota archaeon]|nr:hypothetical protein [Thermoproteota archaeon]
MKLIVKLVGTVRTPVPKGGTELLLQAMKDLAALSKIHEVVKIEKLTIIDEDGATCLEEDEAVNHLSTFFKLLSTSGERYPKVITRLLLESGKDTLTITYYSRFDLYVLSCRSFLDMDSRIEKLASKVRKWLKHHDQVRLLYILRTVDREVKHGVQVHETGLR